MTFTAVVIVTLLFNRMILSESVRLILVYFRNIVFTPEIPVQGAFTESGFFDDIIHVKHIAQQFDSR